jgi:hypothetical protein
MGKIKKWKHQKNGNIEKWKHQKNGNQKNETSKNGNIKKWKHQNGKDKYQIIEETESSKKMETTKKKMETVDKGPPSLLIRTSSAHRV